MSDFCADLWIAAALAVCLGVVAPLEIGSRCPSCPLSVAADFPSVAMLDGPPILRSK